MLSSPRNPRVRDAAALRRTRDRRRRGLHLADGPNAVSAAIEAGLARTVFVDAGRDDPASWVSPDGPEVVAVDARVVGHLSDSVTPQAVVAVVRSATVDLTELVARVRSTSSEPDRTGVLLVVDRVADPGNLGTILRTARAFGVVGVALTAGCADVFAPKTIRSTAGAIYGLPVATDVAPHAVVAACNAAGVGLLGLAVDARSDLDTVLSPRVARALVVGSEAHGIAPELAVGLDESARIPMRDGVESLNVAVATGIALYVASRTGEAEATDPGAMTSSIESDDVTP